MSIFPIVMLVFQMVKRYNSFPCSCVFGPAKGGGFYYGRCSNDVFVWVTFFSMEG